MLRSAQHDAGVGGVAPHAKVARGSTERCQSSFCFFFLQEKEGEKKDSVGDIGPDPELGAQVLAEGPAPFLSLIHI